MKKLKDLSLDTIIITPYYEDVLKVGDLTLNDLNKLKNLGIYIAEEKKIKINKDNFIEELINTMAYIYDGKGYSPDGNFLDKLYDNAQSDKEFQKATTEFLKEFERIYPKLYEMGEKVEVE